MSLLPLIMIALIIIIMCHDIRTEFLHQREIITKKSQESTIVLCGESRSFFFKREFLI